jgi:hypothetical protein
MREPPSRTVGVRRPLGLDPFLLEGGEGRVEIVHGQRDVPVAGADVIAALGRLEVVRELEFRAVAARK